MEHIVLIIRIACIFQSVFGLYLIVRYKKHLRARLISEGMLLGFPILISILIIHMSLNILNFETDMIEALIHFVWTALFISGPIVLIQLSKVLQGYFSLSLTSYQSIVKQMTEMYSPAAAKAIIYASAKNAGYNDTVRLKERTGRDNEDFVRWLIRMCENLGWGRYEILSLQVGEHLRLRIYGSFESEGMKLEASSNHVCTCFQIGYWAGVAKGVRPSMECEGRVVECSSEGAHHCEFEVIFSTPPDDG